jgi:SPP1 gp7 family putative phage head morphogenesis protein
MAQAYQHAWARIRETLDQLLAVYERETLAGKQLGDGYWRALSRADALYSQIERELRAYADMAEITIIDQKQQAAQMARLHAEVLTKTAMGKGPAGVNVAFNRLPTEAVKNIVGATVEGSPLRRLLDALGAEVSEAARREMTTGMALGYNPRKVAGEIRKQVGMGLDRSLRIARTEMIKAYRETTRQSFLENGQVVKGWLWQAACDLRTCPACWAMHGTKHGLEETCDDHPNGRCGMTPIVATWAVLGFPDVPEAVGEMRTGVDRFAGLNPDKQRDILGPAAYAAYRDGAITLPDMVGQKYSPEWGSMRYARSLVSMLGPEKSMRYRRTPAGE